MYHPDQSPHQSFVETILVLAAFVGCWIAGSLFSKWGVEHNWFSLQTSLYVEVLCNGVAIFTLIGITLIWGRSPITTIGLNGSRWFRQFTIGLLAIIPAYAVTAGFSIAIFFCIYLFSSNSAENIVRQKAPMIEMVSSVSPWMVLPVALFVGIYEEVLFRGFILGRLISATKSKIWAIVICSVIFGLFHWPSQGWMGAVQTSVLGAMMATLATWRRSLWPAIACHAGIDTLGITLVIFLKPMLEQLTRQGFSAG